MSNPKFLPVEKRVQYNIRLPQRLIDKYVSYAELTGNTTTNVINTVLDDFIADKVVLNDYLDDIGGIAVKIPYAVYQKFNLTADKGNSHNKNLLDYGDKEKIYTYAADGTIGGEETYFAELFEIKKIPNNLDIYADGSYTANKKNLLFNQNATHSGIELFVYNITETLVADAFLLGNIDSFENALYCLYFEINAADGVNIYLIDYLKAINLLSASGNDEYKNLIIACVKELKEIDEIANSYSYDLENMNHDAEMRGVFPDEVGIDEKENEYIKILNSAVSTVVDKYNSNNIIPFGKDIFSRLAIKEIEVKPDYFDEIIDEKVADRIAKLEKENETLKADIQKLMEYVKK